MRVRRRIAIFALIVASLAFAGEAAASTVTGTYIPDDRFGDINRMSFEGDTSANDIIVRYAGSNRWLVSDQSGIVGIDRCAQQVDENTVACLLPEYTGLRVQGGPGRDRLRIGHGRFGRIQVMLGGGGDRAHISGQILSVAQVFGRGGDDLIALSPSLTAWKRQIRGGAGSDTLLGSYDADVLQGGGGDDAIRAGAGDDLVIGGVGADRLHGGYGDDNIDSGRDEQIDLFECGSGSDIARFAKGDVFRGHNCEDRYLGAGTLHP